MIRLPLPFLAALLPLCWGQTHLLRLRSLDVVSGIRMRFATTKVRAVVENPSFAAQEYHFVSYLPEHALVTNFTMEVDNYQSIAVLKERSRADDLFTVARKAGATAATTSADANVFTTKVNIGAGKRIHFELTYEEVLTRAHGVYKHVVNVQPNLEVETMRARVRIVERGRIDRNRLRVPQFGYALAARDNRQLLDAPQEAGVLVKSSITDSVSIVDISFAPPSGGQLVVLYDVERGHDAGYLEVVNGYFLHFFAPPPDAHMRKGNQNLVLVLDASYSMCGQRWDALKSAIRSALEELSEADFFNLLTANARVSVWELASVPATQANIARAMDFLAKVSHQGGADFAQGLKVGLDLLRVDEASPMISSLVFVTDGYASQGQLSAPAIVRDVTRMNRGRKWAIHTLGLGREADHGLLSKLSAYNRGIARRIYEDGTEDVAQQIAGFFRELRSPLLRDVKVKYLDDNVDMRSLVTQQGPAARTYWDGGEILVAGKLKRSVKRSMEVEVEGITEEGKTVTLKTSGSVRRLRRDSTGGFLERMWGYLQIKDLLRTAAGTVSPRKRRQHRSKALALAKRFNFVTELTSLLVIPLELGGDARDFPDIIAPAGGKLESPVRSPVVRVIGEEAAGASVVDPLTGAAQRLGPVAGAPTEEAVFRVDAIRAELGPGSDKVGNPSSHAGILEHNSIAIDPLSNVDLQTLIGIANPQGAKDVDGIWRNGYLGPVTRTTQGYARLLPSLDPGTRQAAAELRASPARCGNGEKMDVILAMDVSEDDAKLGGPAIGYLIRSLAQRLVGALAFARLSTRFGLAVFAPDADRTAQLYSLAWNQNPNALINILAKIGPETADSSEYLNAFNLAYDMFSDEGRDGAQRVLVLLSAKDSYGRHRTIADTMKNRGIKIITVAPHQSRSSKQTQLSFVAGDRSRVLTQPSVDDLLGLFCNDLQPPRQRQ